MQEDAYSLLNTKQAAAWLAISHITLERWRTTGEGPRFQRIGSKIVRYKLADLEAFARPATSTSADA